MKKFLLVISMIAPLTMIFPMHHEGVKGDNPFLLIARIQVKPGKVNEYLEIADTVDNGYRQLNLACCFITLILTL